MAKAFSESALKSYESFIAMQVSGFMKKLANGVEQAGPDQKGQRAFNMAYEFNCLMLDIMGGLCFGEAFGFVSGQGDHIMEQAHKRAFRIYMTGHEPLLRRLYLDRLLFPGLLKASNVLGNYAKMNTLRRIERHRTSGVTTSELYGHEDIMAHLLEAGDEETGTKYTPDELLGEGVLMMMAGSDTSSSTLTATLFYLSFHPNALARVHAELDSRFLTTESINPQEAQSCTYLRACIDEAMRLSPPAPTNIPRLVGEGGIIVTGKPLGTGVYVGVPNFALFRDPRYFDRPHDYIPERWIPAILQDNKDLKAVSAAFQPFSIGPRHCIGRHLAMKEVSFILAHLLYRFDVGPVGSSGILKRDMYGLGKKVVMAQHDVYTSVEGDISVRLRLRKVD
ncbi:cytochrome P450 [Aspergillus oleicola]